MPLPAATLAGTSLCSCGPEGSRPQGTEVGSTVLAGADHEKHQVTKRQKRKGFRPEGRIQARGLGKRSTSGWRLLPGRNLPGQLSLCSCSRHAGPRVGGGLYWGWGATVEAPKCGGHLGCEEGPARPPPGPPRAGLVPVQWNKLTVVSSHACRGPVHGCLADGHQAPEESDDGLPRTVAGGEGLS